MKKKWFETWFDSPYYHILYKSRDEHEAAVFIPRLINKINLRNDAILLDLACGKGRHAAVMAQSAKKVVGIDLSPNSIEEAKQKYNGLPNIEFIRADMLDFKSELKFDAVFNLFTSFGYFDHFDENCAVLKNISSLLKSDGLLIIDFMNSAKIVKELKSDENKTIEGNNFCIHKQFKDGLIRKRIKVNNNNDLEFCEQVQYIDLPMFEEMLNKSDFKITRTFGDYHLNPFDVDKSDRLILECRLKD